MLKENGSGGGSGGGGGGRRKVGVMDVVESVNWRRVSGMLWGIEVSLRWRGMGEVGE